MKDADIRKAIAQLAARTRTISRTGVILLSAAAIISVLAGGALFTAHLLQPDFHDFTLYVPDVLIPNVGGGLVSSLVSPLTPLFDFIENFGFVIAILTILSAGARAVMSGESLAAAAVLSVMGLVMLPVMIYLVSQGSDTDSDSMSGPERIHQFVKDDSAKRLLEYIDSNISTPEEKLSWEYACVSAQVAIKTGKPAAEMAKKAVEGYAKDFKTLKRIPPDISYAMEKAAFNQAVSAPALRYEKRSLKKAAFLSGIARFGFYSAGSLLILGLMLYSCSLRFKRRVSFLQSMQSYY